MARRVKKSEFFKCHALELGRTEIHIIGNLSTNINHNQKRYIDTGSAISTNNLHFSVEVLEGCGASSVSDAVALHLLDNSDLSDAGYSMADFKLMLITTVKVPINGKHNCSSHLNLCKDIPEDYEIPMQPEEGDNMETMALLCINTYQHEGMEMLTLESEIYA
jgi:hypothetical protein